MEEIHQQPIPSSNSPYQPNQEISIVMQSEVDAFQPTPLHLASKNGDMDAIRALLENNTSACLVYDNNGFIPLHYAVINGQIEIMKQLINAMPQSIWMKLNNGRTVLHLCVESDHLESMKLFIETFMNRHEGFLNTTDDKGNTILDLSMMLRQKEMVEYLLSIPKLICGTSLTNFTASNAMKEGPNLQQTETIKLKRQKRKIVLSSTKKMRGRVIVSRKRLKYKGDWVGEVRGTIMLVATVIATVTFQAGVNPPGGVWEQDILYNSTNGINNQNDEMNYLPSNLNNKTKLAGTAIMAYQQPSFYWNYSMANTLSFMASVGIILLTISRVPLKNKFSNCMLTLAMVVAVVFLIYGYLLGVAMINIDHFYRPIASCAYSFGIYFLFGLVGLVFLFHMIRFFKWVINLFYT